MRFQKRVPPTGGGKGQQNTKEGPKTVLPAGKKGKGEEARAVRRAKLVTAAVRFFQGNSLGNKEDRESESERFIQKNGGRGNLEGSRQRKVGFKTIGNASGPVTRKQLVQAGTIGE